MGRPPIFRLPGRRGNVGEAKWLPVRSSLMAPVVTVFTDRLPAMVPFLEVIIGAIVWTIANLVYLDLKRKGVHGFTRFAAFWLGTPTTWVTLFAVREGRRPTFENTPDDDGSALLEEIRRDRALRDD